MPKLAHMGRSLAYTDQGRGEPVLFLHGIGSRGADWKPQTEALGDNYRVITLDFSGHGDSSPFRELQGIEDLVREVLALLDHLQLERAHIVGLSLGGLVAFNLLALAPERARSLTIINSGPGGSGSRWMRLVLVYTRILLLKFYGLQQVGERIAERLFPDESQKQLSAQFLESLHRVDLPTYKRILKSIAHFDVTSKIYGQKTPVLAICGDRDYTPISEKEQYISQLPQGHLVMIENSGHATPMDQAAACSKAILDFLSYPPTERGD